MIKATIFDSKVTASVLAVIALYGCDTGNNISEKTPAEMELTDVSMLPDPDFIPTPITFPMDTQKPMLVQVGEFPDNVEFQGTTKLFSRNGFGREFYKNQTLRYQGMYEGSSFEGEGLFFLQDGTLRYSGTFTRNNYLSGVLFNASGNILKEGTFNCHVYDSNRAEDMAAICQEVFHTRN